MSDSNGRKIAAIRRAIAPQHIDPCIRSTPEAWLQWHEDYHGDRDVAWVVWIKNGVEIARFNPNYIESIEWSVPIGGSEHG